MTSPGEDEKGETGGIRTGEDTVARVYRELWLSLVSIPPLLKCLPCVHRREEAPAARKGCAGATNNKRRARGKREGTTTGRGQGLTWKRM